MTWHTISSPANNTSTRFGGEQMNRISNMFNEVDIGDTVSINNAVIWHFTDEGLLLEASGDRTKQAEFDLNAITTGTKRTYSLPDFDMMIGATVVGKHDYYIDPTVMYPTTTNGCQSITQTEFATNDINLKYFAFNDSIEENLQFAWIPPRYYDGTPGTIKVKLLWYVVGGSASEVIRWGIKVRSRADGGTIDAAFGTEIALEDTFIANNALHVTDLSAAITPSNAAKDTQMIINIARKAAHANDTLTGDARLIGVIIEWDRDDAVVSP